MTSKQHSSSPDSLRVVTAPARDVDSDGAFSNRHLLGIADLSASDILDILDLADTYADSPGSNSNLCGGLTLANLFFENSTRTQLSFDLAGQRLGMNVINLATATSSLKKGETLMDTALTVGAMGADVMVVRHAEMGAVAEIAARMPCPVINAGDGTGEHPTQALADALTIRRRKGKLEGLVVAICGDIAHSRVANSNLHLLGKLGAVVRLVGPKAFLPQGALLPIEARVETFTDLEEGIKDADVVMMLRIQKERMDTGDVPSGSAVGGAAGGIAGGAASDDYFRSFGLDHKKLGSAKKDAIVMHPGPMNRGVEISSELADDEMRSAILTQVGMGVAVRMASLDLLARPIREQKRCEQKRHEQHK